MIETGMIVAWILTGAVRTEILKSKQLDLTQEIKDKIEQEGLYHITSKEAAEQIVKSGYILPTKGIIDNHFAKSRYGDKFADFVYMFAGKPTVEMFKCNLSHRVWKDGTIYAVKHTPNKYELSNYTERLEDRAITYEGRLDIANSNPQLVRMRLEKGKLIEIPWDEPTNESFLDQIKELSAIKLVRSIPTTFRELKRNVTFRDKEGRLKKCVYRRREENKMLEQYNNDTQQKVFSISKNGIAYTASTIGTKMCDGKPLTGFRISQDGTDFTKNVFMDAMDITQIADGNLSDFLSNYMNEQCVRTEYIGKPTIEGGKVSQQLDEEYAHHFYAKQLMVARNDATYSQYVQQENSKKETQLRKFARNVFINTS